MGELGGEAAAMHAEVGAFAREAGIDALLALGEASRARGRRPSAVAARHFADVDALIEAAGHEAGQGRDAAGEGLALHADGARERRAGATGERPCCLSSPNDLEQYVRTFNVFTYITLRVVLAALTALVISFIVGPAMIRKLTAYKIGQAVRDDGPQTHLVKTGTPTMGGALILVSVAITTLLWADLTNRYVWIVLLTTLGFGAVGWVDDWRKVVHRNPKGLSARAEDRLAVADRDRRGHLPRLQREAAAADRAHRAVLQDRRDPAGRRGLRDPRLLRGRGHLQRREPHRRPRRARDHAHGDDRLGARGVRLRLGPRGVLEVPRLPVHLRARASSRSSAARSSGAGLAFLWFNAYPAEVFMGDVGALALGAALGHGGARGAPGDRAVRSWAACSWSRRSP